MSNDTSSKPDYRDTVFLPKTDFPMRGGLPQKEPEILQKWQDMDLYGQMRKTAKGKKKFVLHDGPPYANGNIHMGHAVNKILKDVVVKSYSMMGYDAPYVPGWDCHGLPIEWKIEEKYRNAGKNKDDVPVLEFREECRQFAQGWVDTQSAQFQRLGVTGEWSNPYRTMTTRAEGLISREIHKFALNGGLYKGLRPVMWSTVEKTALAEAEVEYKEHKSITIWVRFPIVEPGYAFSFVEDDHKDTPETKRNQALLDGAEIVIWTTTPWTIPSNRAIAFGVGIEYGVYEVVSVSEDSTVEVGAKLVFATTLAEGIKQHSKIEEWKLLGAMKGDHLEGTICRHPLADVDPHYSSFSVPVLGGHFVTDDAGTGFVHIAPGHGEDDFVLARAHNDWIERSGKNFSKIEITDNVTDDGKFRPHVGLFAGLEVYTQDGKLGDGNFAVLKELKEAGKLLAKGSVKHDYPHSWRSKAPVIFRTTPQWFIAMDGEGEIRTKALAAIKDTNWIPAKGEARITAMIENRPDWCISRQRAWGVPIALFLHKDTGEVLIDEELFDCIDKVFEEEGADAWYKDGVEKRFLGDKADQYQKVNDIVDVWFESGSTHAFVVGDTKTWPCYEGVKQIDLYLEGSDQHRGWFHSSLLESCGTNGHAPYKNVLTHGFVLDDKGYKMSKSLGNVVDPLKMMEEHGADIIRLWVMLSDYQEDIRIGKDTLKNTGDLYRRLRNTLRFLLGALDGFTAEERVDLSDERVPELERYMLHLLAEMDAFVRGCIKDYQFGKLAKRLHDFCNQELSAFYFDIRKDRLYCDRPDLFERRACRMVMAEIFSYLTAWLAPILAFTAEEAWSHRPQGVFEDAASVHLRDFPDVPRGWRNEQDYYDFDYVRAVRSVALGALEIERKNGSIGSALEAKLKIFVSYDQISEGANISSVRHGSIGFFPNTEIIKNMKAKWPSYEWADFCGVSSVEFEEVASIDSDTMFTISSVKGVGVKFEKAPGSKCERCWKVLPEVSEESGHLCNRCSDAVDTQKKSKAA